MGWKSSLGLLTIGLTIATAAAIAQDAQTEAAVRKKLEEAERSAKMFGLITKRENLVITQRAKGEPSCVASTTIPMRLGPIALRNFEGVIRRGGRFHRSRLCGNVYDFGVSDRRRLNR